LRDDDAASAVAATLFGEGMSSPLLDRVREQRGLAYHASCSADVFDMCGQMVIEASTAPEQATSTCGKSPRCWQRMPPRSTRSISTAHAIRSQCGDCTSREAAAPARGRGAGAFRARTHPPAQRNPGAPVAVTGEEVRAAFERMLAAGPSAAIVGRVGRGAASGRERSCVECHRRSTRA